MVGLQVAPYNRFLVPARSGVEFEEVLLRQDSVLVGVLHREDVLNAAVVGLAVVAGARIDEFGAQFRVHFAVLREF